MQSLTQISITTSSLTLLACGQPKPKALLPVTPYSFLINLGQGKETLNLHFNPRFDESTIVCNTSEGGRWGQEQRENHMCFSPGSEVKVRSKENPTKALQPQPGESHQAPVRTLPWLS